MEIVLRCNFSNGKAETNIAYRGKCSYFHFDRAILAMITTLLDAREKEMLSSGAIDKMTKSGKKSDEIDYSEFEKP